MRNKLYLQNRINLLNNRGKENGRIVKKLERQLRALEKKESQN
jgi:hypothetical protein